jgi:hypothetical protein
LLLALLILALSEPVFSVRPTNVAVVLDNSASMQTVEDGKTRMTLAKQAANSVIGELSASGKIDLYLTTPQLAKARPAPLLPPEARAAVDAVRAYDLADPPIDYDHVLSQLASERKYERVYLITDHPGRGQTATARVITVGRAQPNLALTGFEVHRSSLVNTRMEAVVKVSNFSDREERIKVVLKGNGATLASRALLVGADKSAIESFEGFAEQPSYEAAIEADDALPLDNRRFAIGPSSRNLQILAVTPRPQPMLSLRLIPGIRVDVISPAEYENSERTGYGLEIFHFSAPEGLPRNPALFILPPESSSLVKAGTPTSNVSVSSWREPHMLTRYINFSLFRPTYARPLKPQSAGDVVIESPNGALAFAIERQGVRYLTLGFDPLPFLGRDNLPMSIFTLNLLDWFFDSGGASGQATGEPIRLGSVRTGDVLTTPAGEKVSLKTDLSSFSATFYQGVYRRTRGTQKELYARNLQDTHESDLRAPAPVELRGTAASSGSASVLFSFWPYLLVASLLLLLIEWFINPRLAFRFRRGARQAVRAGS